MKAIAEACLSAGISVDEETAGLLARHVDLAYEAGAHQNLTRVPRDQAPLLHVVDSLLGLEAMKASGSGDWADIGSGAGFPGIPLCVRGVRHVDLIESVAKKSRFLNTVAAELCLDVTVRECRAEEAAQESRDRYASVSVRAVGALSELTELAAPLLRMGGALVAWKGAPTDEELRRGAAVGRMVGLAMREVRPYGLPSSEARRTLVVFEKVAGSRVRLPRRPGLARSRPLA